MLLHKHILKVLMRDFLQIGRTSILYSSMSFLIDMFVMYIMNCYIVICVHIYIMTYV